MSKYIVELWLDGYENDVDRTKAEGEFIYEQLNFSASSVKVTPLITQSNSNLEKLAAEHAESEGNNGNAETSFIAGWNARQQEVNKLRAVLVNIKEIQCNQAEYLALIKRLDLVTFELIEKLSKAVNIAEKALEDK